MTFDRQGWHGGSIHAHASPALLLVALLACGCVTRLPVAEPTTAGLGAPVPAAPPMPVQVPEERVARIVERASRTDDCFVRCGLEREFEAPEVEEEELERHEIALFFGYTFERGEGGATVGLDYAYWLEEWFGVGAFGDYVAGELDAFAGGVGVWFRPFKKGEGLTLFAGPGIDVSKDEEEGEESWEARALIRLGATYAIDLGRGFRFLPSFYYDVIFPDKQAYVLGLTIGKEF